MGQFQASKGCDISSDTKDVRYEKELPESTNIADLVKSGRYKVASKETLELMSAVQGQTDTDKVRPDSLIKDLKSYIVEQEGLDIGESRKKVLSQQWRFFLSCEPIQRGLDAGIVAGSFASALVAFRSSNNRTPVKIGLVFISGLSVGVIMVPMLVVAAEIYNNKKIKKLEEELFARQRAEFHSKGKKDS
ncbi:hypothetical protein TRVL_08279 [Trypanosoma vivax]|nr:hypothetical protein TRVL_08279 [Trypanosoma vivax]